MLRRSISSSVANLTSGKATHRKAGKAWLCLGMTADRSYEPFGSLPGGSLASPRMMTTCGSWLSTKRGHAVVAWALKDWTHIPRVPPVI